MNYFSSPAQTGHSHLRRLILLRSITIVGQLAVLALAWHVLEWQLQWQPMLATIAVEILFNFISWWRLRRDNPVSNAELFIQLCIDVAALSVLLYYSGGSTNPFISLYLLSLIIAAATLSRVWTWLMAILTTACYSLLMKFYVPLPMAEGEHAHMHHAMQSDDIFSIHVLGMWFGFVISAIVIAYFVVKMASAVRERDEALARIREATLRNERIVELGMQAAGAAHEMGTPLSTMLVVIGELQHEVQMEAKAQPEWQNSLNLLESQVRTCKRILDKMLASAQDQTHAQHASLEQFMLDTLDEWQLLRPTAKYAYQTTGTQPSPQFQYEPSLRAALLNLLNNAADASPQKIDIHAHWTQDSFTLEIRDFGKGVSPAATSRLGKAFFTTKQEGRGLGLFLANTTLERLGGKVRLVNRDGGGATTEVSIPLAGAA